jgi:hypothetical protein
MLMARKLNIVKRYRLIQFGLFLMMMGTASLMTLNSQNLEKHTWKNRILIVKTFNSSSEIYQQQIKEFDNAADELKVRKFVLYKITGDEYEMIDFTNSKLNDSGKITGKPIGKDFNDKENFEVILIGLDGGIKLRQTEVLTKEALFNIVDAMPMRRSEIDRNKE